MILKRHIKQVVYFVAFSSTATLLCAGLLFIITRPSGPPAPTPTPPSPYEPIAVEEVHVISHEAQADVVARVRNPNATAGIIRYPITFTLLSSTEQVVASRIVETYILPGSVAYISELNIPVKSPIARVKVDLPAEPSFMPIPTDLTLPAFSTFLRERSQRAVAAKTMEEQKGVVRNLSTLPWQTVEVTGVALDSGGQVVGVGRTFIGELRPGEEREFTLQWPIPLRPTNQVSVLTTTNIFKEDDIIKVIGDPALLR